MTNTVKGIDWLLQLEGATTLDQADDADTIAGIDVEKAVTPASLMAALAALVFPVKVEGISGTLTNLVNVVNTSATVTNGLNISRGVYSGAPLLIGDFAASLAAGSGVVFTASMTGVIKAYGESTSDLTSAKNARTIVGRHLVSLSADTVINHEAYGIVGQLVVKNGSLNHYHGGVMGTFESGTLAHIQTSYGVGAVIGRIGAESTIIESGGLLAAFLAVENTTTITATGTFAAFATKLAAGKTAFPIGLYMAAGDVTKGIDITCSAIGATGRIAKLAGSIANGALTDGYGAVEVDLTMTGTATDTVAALSTWVNLAASSSAGSTMVCAQNNGIYVSATGTPMASATAIIGMRMQYVAEGGGNPGALYLFSTNIYDNALTAMFHVNAAVDLSWTTGAKSTNAGSIPLFKDVTGNKTWYVNVYDG